MYSYEVIKHQLNCKRIQNDKEQLSLDKQQYWFAGVFAFFLPFSVVSVVLACLDGNVQGCGTHVFSIAVNSFGLINLRKTLQAKKKAQLLIKEQPNNDTYVHYHA